MKALSIKQPWLYAICRLGKRVENRTWRPGRLVLGQRVALHAGKKEDDAVLTHDISYAASNGPGAFSAIIAVATVAEVVCTSERARELGQERWWADRPRNVGHLLADVVELPQPITGVKGALSYWELPPEIERQVREQMGPR